jgi:small-conductance mechanosensitive channel
LGDQVKINQIEGTVEAIDNISMTLKTEKGKIIIPIKDVVESQVEISVK